MAKQKPPYDPLQCLPDPDFVARQLVEAETRAQRLRTLLRVIREVHANPGTDTPTISNREEVASAS